MISGWIGKFLASKATSLVLLTVLGGAGSYIAYVIQDRGALQERLAQERESAQAWRDHAAAVAALENRFDAYDRELRDARQAREAFARDVDRQIEGLRRDQPDVDRFLSHRAPVALARVLCDDGTIDPDSPACVDADP